MRTCILALVLSFVVAGLAIPAVSGGSGAGVVIVAQEQPVPPPVQVEIERRDTAWYTSPVWIAIGVIAIVLLVVIVAMAARGTTVIRD
jgi:hypothetical protein